MPGDLITSKFVIDEEKELDFLTNNKLDSDDITRKDSSELINEDVNNEKLNSSFCSVDKGKLHNSAEKTSQVEMINNLLEREREMFKLQDKKLGESRSQYCEMIALNADLEETMEYLRLQFSNSQEQIKAMSTQIEKKVNFKNSLIGFN